MQWLMWCGANYCISEKTALYNFQIFKIENTNQYKLDDHSNR